MTKKRIPALKLELVNYSENLLYLSLLEYKRECYLCIIDNVQTSEIGAYVLDFAEQENIPLQEFFSIVTKWFYGKSEFRPLSIELAENNLTHVLAPIYRTFDTSYVTRIVGHAFSYEEMSKSKVRRRRVVAIPEGIAIKIKKN